MNYKQLGSVYLDPGRITAKDPVFVDIGANTGKVSHALLDQFGGKAIAYEPGAVGDSIKPRQGLIIKRQAVYTRCGTVEFNDFPQQSCSSTVCDRKPRRGEVVKRTVDYVSLSIALRGIEWIDFLS